MGKVSEEMAWKLVLHARAGLLKGGFTPGVWTERMPGAEEVGELYSILMETQPPNLCAAQLVAGITDADKERGGDSFATGHPQIMRLLEAIAIDPERASQMVGQLMKEANGG